MLRLCFSGFRLFVTPVVCTSSIDNAGVESPIRHPLLYCLVLVYLNGWVCCLPPAALGKCTALPKLVTKTHSSMLTSPFQHVTKIHSLDVSITMVIMDPTFPVGGRREGENVNPTSSSHSGGPSHSIFHFRIHFCYLIWASYKSNLVLLTN